METVDKAMVCEWFNLSDFEGRVIFAQYETPDYEGYADVIYLLRGKFYWVSDSHCSCNGLENWSPEEMPVSGFRRIAETGRGGPHQGAREVFEFLKQHDLENETDEAIERKLMILYG
jgi:hypothetical protein